MERQGGQLGKNPANAITVRENGSVEGEQGSLIKAKDFACGSQQPKEGGRVGDGKKKPRGKGGGWHSNLRVRTRP